MSIDRGQAVRFWGGLFNAIADLYICDGFVRLLRRRKVKLAMWLRELLKAIARTSLIEYRKQLANPHRYPNIVDITSRDTLV